MKLSTLVLARPVLAAFAAMAVLWGCFAAELPDIKAKLAISEAELGLLLFLTPIAAVLAMAAAPAFGAALGRWALPLATMLMAASIALPGQVSHYWLFPVAMLACGASTGLTDVLMNARIAALESGRGVHLMTFCYAIYSFSFAGSAVLTGVLRGLGWSPAWVMGAMALIAILLALATYDADGRIDGLKKPKAKAAARLGWVPVIGGAIVLISFMTENAAEMWSALFIEQTLGGSPAAGALGPASIAVSMGLARLVGQSMVHRVGALWLLCGGAVVAAVGAVTAALATSTTMAYGGFLVMGIGGSLLVPTTFSLVGALVRPEAQARAIARATLLGYFGYFIGPPVLGMLAGALGLRTAFVFAGVMLLSILVLGPMLLRRRD